MKSRLEENLDAVDLVRELEYNVISAWKLALIHLHYPLSKSNKGMYYSRPDSSVEFFPVEEDLEANTLWLLEEARGIRAYKDLESIGPVSDLWQEYLEGYCRATNGRAEYLAKWGIAAKHGNTECISN